MAEPKLEPNSVKNYKPALRRAVEEFGGAAGRQYHRQRDRRIYSGLCRRAGEEDRRHAAAGYPPILRWAELQGKTNYNPAQAVRVPRNLPQTRREAPDKDQIAKIKASTNLPFGLFRR